MLCHSKYPEVKTLVEANINTLCVGSAGSGKTTIFKNLAEDLKLNFNSISMTRQTTLNALIGFISINGNYIPSILREAVEHGGMMLLDEIDAADPNTLLCLNTLENGYMSFPDGIVNVHPEFRLVATANPIDEHSIYTGRSKLDHATLDRFDVVEIERDESLELALTSADVMERVGKLRTLLKEQNISRTISMRDSIRYFKRAQIGLATDYHRVLLGDKDIIELYETTTVEEPIEEVKPKDQRDMSIDELWNNMPDESVTEASPITQVIDDTGQHSLDAMDAAVYSTAVNAGTSSIVSRSEAREVLIGYKKGKPLPDRWEVYEDGPSCEPFTEDPLEIYTIIKDQDGFKHKFSKKEIQ